MKRIEKEPSNSQANLQGRENMSENVNQISPSRVTILQSELNSYGKTSP